MLSDRFGLGWRPELAAGILRHRERVEVVEVIADDYFDAPRAEVRALCTLAGQIPVVLHAASLGLASCAPADRGRVEAMARLVAALRPEAWSERLAFVRAGGIEIGHLAAPPRTPATTEGAARNLAARAVVGAAPLVENVATLIDPPGSDQDEGTWIAEVLTASGCDLLLDLHNLYANAVNFAFDPLAALRRIPPQRIRAIHLAGGQWVPARVGQRLPDDHRHDVPDPVYDLLAEVGRLVPAPLTVILERTGAYPPIEALLAQLDRACHALAAVPPEAACSLGRDGMNFPRFEAFLARIYVDPEARARFLADPAGEGRRARLTEAERAALERIDGVGLELAAVSFAQAGAQTGRQDPDLAALARPVEVRDVRAPRRWAQAGRGR